MPITNFIARPVPTPYVQWTGDNIAEIRDVVLGSGGGPWTVTDNEDGTITISASYASSGPIENGQYISVAYPQSGVDLAALNEYHQQLPGDGPYAYGITES